MTSLKRRLEAGLALGGLVLVALLVLVYRHQLRDSLANWDFNAIRLQRSFALAAGESIYTGADSGLVLSTIYGPIGAVAYLPAVLASTPSAAILIGLALSLLFVFAPLALLARQAAPGRSGRLPLGLALCALAAAIADLRPLSYVATTIHVDAPALGLGALAIAALGPVSRQAPIPPARLALSAVCAVLAVWTKQVMVPLLVALPAALLLVCGVREAVRFTLRLGVAGLLVSGLLIALFGPLEVLYFNLIEVPARHPLRLGGGPPGLVQAAGRLLAETAAGWAVAALAWALLLRERRRLGQRSWPPAGAALLATLVGLAMLPTALLGRLKEYGDANASAYTAYYLLAGALLVLLELARESRTRGALLLFGIASLQLASVLVLEAPSALSGWRQPLVHPQLPHELAYRYAKAHPGEIYFPRLTLASHLAEGTLYHQSVGLLDRRLAGYPVTGAHLRAHLPSGLRAIAFDRNGYEAERTEVMLPELVRRSTDPELPGFILWVREPEPAPLPADSPRTAAAPDPPGDARLQTAQPEDR